MMLLSCVRRPFRCALASRKLCSSNRFWKWTTEQRPSWKEDNKEKLIACIVFAITGTASVTLVRPLLKDVVGLEGSFIEGPWSYRLSSVLLVSPVYAVMLLTFGTLSGRHRFFSQMSFKILGRFFPKSLLNKIVCKPAREKASKP